MMKNDEGKILKFSDSKHNEGAIKQEQPQPKYICKKHGSVGLMRLIVQTDIGTSEYKRDDYCMYCYKEFLDANVNKTVKKGVEGDVDP